MANVVKETYLGQVQQNEGSANSSLDKLAQLGKRAARKFVQKPIIEALIEISAEQKDAKTRKGTPWIKHFSNIPKCSSILKSTGDKVTARYCSRYFPRRSNFCILLCGLGRILFTRSTI